MDIKNMIDNLLEKAKIAKEEYNKLTQEQVDFIIKKMSMAALDNHMYLAKLAIEETKRGVYEDKITKNIFSSEYIYHNIKNNKTVGVIEDNEEEGYQTIAEGVGIIAGITPVTNPTSTTCFKSLIAAKTRNVIVFAFHPSAQNCSKKTAEILKTAAVKAGAPKDCILWIENPSIEATTQLMNHEDVDLILATGGSNMVKQAYSCQKPALGVGPGNVPCFIEQTANLRRSINDLVVSKSFDNGMICASEQSVVIQSQIKEQFEGLMKDAGCYFVNEIEKEKLKNYMFKLQNDKYELNNQVVGQNATDIAYNSNFEVPKNTKILVVREYGVGNSYPFSKEKLSPILSYYIEENNDNAITRCKEILNYGGLGHTAVIHSNNQNIINEYATKMKAGRIIVNSPSTHGAIGDIYNSNIPSLTLGCGTYGGNSTTDNVSTINLLNFKKVAKRRVNMQWFKVPEKIYFEKGSIKYLTKMPNIERIFIVTDEVMVKLGYIEKVIYHLNKRENKTDIKIFSSVESDPSFDTIKLGVNEMNQFKPDAIIALGGGSPIDAAKGMWLLYEHPDVDLNGLKLKFMDIRKRTYKYPKLGTKAKLIAIPTTSGTGSEVTSFAVISDKQNNIKYPLADYELTPNVAIIDPELVYSLPKKLVADTGMDALTHAIESYVSTMANDYTDCLCEKAIEIIYNNILKSYNDPTDEKSREKMHNASCIAGMAFTNSFLGINHSIAHQLGGIFHVPHGRCNAILLPYIIKYNAQKPTKFTSFPKYEYYIADERYYLLAKKLNLKAQTKEEGIKSLINMIEYLNEKLNIPKTLKEYGINETEFLNQLDLLAERSFADQCTTTNPRLPLIRELKSLLLEAYYGEEYLL